MHFLFLLKRRYYAGRLNSNLLTCLCVVEGTVLIFLVPDNNSWCSTGRSIRASARIDSVELFIEVIIFLLK